jgi:hypothetical protein
MVGGEDWCDAGIPRFHRRGGVPCDHENTWKVVFDPLGGLRVLSVHLPALLVAANVEPIFKVSMVQVYVFNPGSVVTIFLGVV